MNRLSGEWVLNRSVVRLLFERLVSRTRVYQVYTSSPKQEVAARIQEIDVYDVESPPPEPLVRQIRSHIGVLQSWWMQRRLRRSEAVMLVYSKHDRAIGYGWLQRWRPLRREFWWLAENAIGLGPFWTHPDHRGRGIYGCLLRHALTECDARGWQERYIWAERGNEASLRGIEKAGFVFLGAHRVTLRFFGFIRHHAVLKTVAASQRGNAS